VSNNDEVTSQALYVQNCSGKEMEKKWVVSVQVLYCRERMQLFRPNWLKKMGATCCPRFIWKV